MSTVNINELIAKLQEWETLAADANAEVENIKDQLKEELTARDTEELDTGTHIIRWTSTLSNRFDTKTFKEKYGELYKQYTKQVASRRFSIA